MTDRSVVAADSAGSSAAPPTGPTLAAGVIDAGAARPAASSGARPRRRRRRGPIARARLRSRLVVRRWRHSLQFRAVTIALVGALLVFLVTGSFLSHQISERLFNDSLGQALSQSEADFRQVQASFDASDASDREQVQTLVASTLSGLRTERGADQSRWILLPIDASDIENPNMLPAQSESPWMSEETVPQELREQIAGIESSGDGLYWQSSEASMQEGAPPVPVVIVGQVVEPEEGARYGLYFVYDFAQPQRTLDAMHAVLLLATLVQALLVSGVVGYVTREVVRPVSYTARAAASLADGNLGVRMEVHGAHEVARLGRSFNRMADNLEDQITRLEQLSSMQQTFVSDVSHELRTPLTTVRMAAEVLYNAREDFDPVNRRSSELLHHQVDRFDVLLADLLEISRFDAGAARLEITGVNILTQISGVLEATGMLAANAGSVIRVHSEAQRILVMMDQRRIERILRNLVVNAIEHGDGGPIDVVVRASEHAVSVAVRDYGIGMTEEQTAKVFDRFWRADPARARTTGGTGLGLSISAEDTRLHSGWLDAWGSPGEGACFRLTLPLVQSRPLTDDDEPPVALPPTAEEMPITGVVTETGTMVVIPLDEDSVASRASGPVQLADLRRSDEAALLDADDLDDLDDVDDLDAAEDLEDLDAAEALDAAAGEDSDASASASDAAAPADGGSARSQEATGPVALEVPRSGLSAGPGKAAASSTAASAPGPATRPAIGGAFLGSTAIGAPGGGPRFREIARAPADGPTAPETSPEIPEAPLGDPARAGQGAAAEQPQGGLGAGGGSSAAAPAGERALHEAPAPSAEDFEPTESWPPTGAGVAADEVFEEDDLDVSYEDLFPDDTGELPAFRDVGAPPVPPDPLDAQDRPGPSDPLGPTDPSDPQDPLGLQDPGASPRDSDKES